MEKLSTNCPSSQDIVEKPLDYYIYVLYTKSWVRLLWYTISSRKPVKIQLEKANPHEMPILPPRRHTGHRQPPHTRRIGGETTPLLKRRVAKVRIGLMSTVLPPLWILTCFGDLFVRLLWDPRYAGAGPMLQILSAGSLFWALEAGPIYLARGEAWIGFIVGAARAAVLLPAIAVGGYYFGMIGLVWGVAISQVPYYPLEVWMQRRYGVWTPWVDMLAFGTSMLFIGLGFLLRAHLNI